jgi:vancomycin resistance protein YoaR
VRSSATTLLVLALGSISGVAAGVGAHHALPTSPIARGVNVGERRVPDHGAPEWLSARRDELRSRIVHFQHGDHRFQATLAEAGVEVDVAATLERAAAIGHEGSPLRRLRETARAKRGQVEVPLVWWVNRDKARALLSSFAPALHRPPVDARLDMKTRTKLAPSAGQELDVEASLEQLEQDSHEDEATVQLITWRIPAKVSLEDLTKVDVSKTLAEYETLFVTFGSGAGRFVNIKNAASKIDGIIIPPGEVFSFNDAVGERTLDNGFTWAPEIMGDEMTPGVGGGTCQVSSTLHVAALHGALEMVERQSHSRPSAYTKMGLDATVSYPTVDLKIRNTMTFPVMIHASVPEPDAKLKRTLQAKVKVEILGGAPVATVSYRYGINGTEDFTRRIYTKNYLKPGKRIRHQKGSRGYDVSSWAKIEFFDGRVEERNWFSGYKPAPEVYWVAPGFDVAELPSLPDHAIGVDNRTREARESREGEVETASM